MRYGGTPPRSPSITAVSSRSAKGRYSGKPSPKRAAQALAEASLIEPHEKVDGSLAEAEEAKEPPIPPGLVVGSAPSRPTTVDGPAFISRRMREAASFTSGEAAVAVSS